MRLCNRKGHFTVGGSLQIVMGLIPSVHGGSSDFGPVKNTTILQVLRKIIFCENRKVLFAPFFHHVIITRSVHKRCCILSYFICVKKNQIPIHVGIRYFLPVSFFREADESRRFLVRIFVKIWCHLVLDVLADIDLYFLCAMYSVWHVRSYSLMMSFRQRSNEISLTWNKFDNIIYTGWICIVWFDVGWRQVLNKEL